MRGQAKKARVNIYDKGFKWTISIPVGFDTVNAETWLKMQNRGAEAIEKTYDQKIENNANTIFVFNSNEFNYFESNYQPFDSVKDENYLESFHEVNKMLYGTFESEIKGAQLDSLSLTATIMASHFKHLK